MNRLKKVNSYLVLTPFVLSLILTLIIFILFRFLPAKLPLFYSLPWGDKQLATQGQYFIIPTTLTLIALVNFAISHQLHPSQAFFKKILLVSPLIISLILLISFIKIIFIFI